MTIEAQIVILMPYRYLFQWEMIKGINIDARLRSLMPSGTSAYTSNFSRLLTLRQMHHLLDDPGTQ